MIAEIKKPTLIELEESSAEGQREMSAARLNLRVVTLLNHAFESSGASQKELADRIGVGESRVSQILNGDGNLRVSTFARYLRALGYVAVIEGRPADSSVPPLPTRRPGPRRKFRKNTVIAVQHHVEQNGEFGEAVTFSDEKFLFATVVSSRVLGRVELSSTLNLDTEWNNLDTMPLAIGELADGH